MEGHETYEFSSSRRMRRVNCESFLFPVVFSAQLPQAGVGMAKLLNLPDAPDVPDAFSCVSTTYVLVGGDRSDGCWSYYAQHCGHPCMGRSGCTERISLIEMRW